jgi:hypothetical protein
VTIAIEMADTHNRRHICTDEPSEGIVPCKSLVKPPVRGSRGWHPAVRGTSTEEHQREA